MADFDSNPFADPQESNPFADAAVRQAASSNRQTTTTGAADFNPFEDKNKTQPAPPVAAPQPQPAVLNPTPDPPPAYSPSGEQKLPTDDLKKRQEELEKKAAELQRREHELRNNQFNARENNWPPLPKCCPVGPCFYQDISVDIPHEFQRTTRFLFYIWMIHAIAMFLNVPGSLAYFVSKESDSSDSGVTFGLSILFFVLFTPCSFICWFRPVYKAFRSDSSFNFFLFFFVMFFQCIAHIIQCLGIPSWGSVGWISGLKLVGKDPVVGTIMLVIGFIFSVLAVADAILLIRVHRLYRSTGASFQKAQAEFSTGVMKNEAVQNAASQAGQAAVRGATQEAMGGNKY